MHGGSHFLAVALLRLNTALQLTPKGHRQAADWSGLLAFSLLPASCCGFWLRAALADMFSHRDAIQLRWRQSWSAFVMELCAL